MRRRVTFILAAGLVLSAAPAHAAGGPVPPAQGGVGVSAPGGSDSFVAVSGGAGRTVVMRVRHSDASIQRSRSVAGSYGVPGVTFDGINTGLSADEGTLVISSGMRAYPQASTRLLVLDARTLKSRQHLTLPGMVTVDAISPDGRWLYLVDYKDGNAARYDVRAYDLKNRKLVQKPVVDPREPDEKLQGIPVTRVMSADGRWAYTLYAGDKPFIHALDTGGRTAVCIDVPVTVDDISGIRLTLGGGGLSVVQNGTPVALVNLTSFKVTKPRPAAAVATPRPAKAPREATSDAGPPWALWMLPLAALALLVVLARQRRARHSATSSRAASGHSG